MKKLIIFVFCFLLLAGIASAGVSNPVNGVVKLLNDTVIFAPDPGFVGEASFDYTITGDDGSFSTATVTIVVEPVVISIPPNAVPDSLSMPQDSSIAIPVGDLLKNDEGDGIRMADPDPEPDPGFNDAIACGEGILYQTQFVPGETPWETIVSDPINGGCNGVLRIEVDTTGENGSYRYGISEEAGFYSDAVPDESYYSFWFAIWAAYSIEEGGYMSHTDWVGQYIDANGVVQESISQSIGFTPDPNSEGYLLLISDYHTEDNKPKWEGIIAQSSIPFMVGQWNHLECYRKWSSEETGRVVCWLNDQQIWDAQNIYTEFEAGQLRKWTLKNASSRTDPAKISFYFDEAVISTNRQGMQCKVPGPC